NQNKGACSTASGTACSSCGTCPSYSNLCDRPYGGDWSIDDGDFSLRGYSYFLDGNMILSGIGNANDANVTLIATGYLKLTGNNKFKPVMNAHLSPLQPPFTDPKVQFIVGSDLDFGGNVADSVNFDGLAYAREQISGTGSGTYNG